MTSFQNDANFFRNEFRRCKSFGCYTMIFICTLSHSIFAVDVPTVTVNHPNNLADPASGYGRVDYEYRIGTYEVTNEQYTEFLNAVAKDDTNELYHPRMSDSERGGIEQFGRPGQYTYEVKEHFADKPVIYVNLWDASRFVNWLHNGQPSGAQDAKTTESGAYDLEGILPEVDIVDREPDASWFIPNADEWYKAAYFQPAALGGDADSYWSFATATNDTPTVARANAEGDISNPGPNVVNYQRGANWNGTEHLQSPGNVTTVGSAGESSRSFFGTYDQSGNLAEWVEPPYTEDDFAVLGGLLFSGQNSLTASNAVFVIDPTLEANAGGFRVARINQPTLPGDFNEDNLLDVHDINLITQQIAAQTNDRFFDLNNDSIVDGQELQIWVKEISGTWFGDANLDGEFNSSDFTQVFQAGKYESGLSANWSDGDWNADGVFDSSDLVAAFGDGGYEIGRRAAVAVPEPRCIAVFGLGLLVIMHHKRRRG